MTGGLTKKQSQILLFIEDYIFKNSGVSPSFQEIMTCVDIQSKSNVSRVLMELVDRGFISNQKYRSRSIKVLRPISENEEILRRLFDQNDWNEIKLAAKLHDQTVTEYITASTIYCVHADLMAAA